MNRLMHTARYLRRELRRSRQAIRFGSLKKSPILFANSFPKSGTHLLTQVLTGFTRIGPVVDSGMPAVVTYDGFTGRKRSTAEILRDLQQLLPGDIAYGHVHSFPEAVKQLSQTGWASTFILRDPRDVAVSHVHYVSQMAPKHIHYRYYHDVLTSFPERLQASILGISAEKLQSISDQPVLEPLPNLYQRFEPFLGWLDCPEVLVLRYEEFAEDQHSAVARVFDHAVAHGFLPVVNRDLAIEKITEAVDPKRSPTFRSGKVGGWREAIDPENLQLIQEIMGGLLARLGYQENKIG